MSTVHAEPSAWTNSRETAEVRHERWAHCHVSWTAVIVGALAAFAVVMLVGLIGVAVGVHLLGPDHRVVDLKQLGFGSLIFSVSGAFFAFVVGGWVSGKIAGILHSEPAMLHGAIVFLVAVPMLVLTAGLGAGSALGGWYAGMASNSTASPYVHPFVPGPGATTEDIKTYREKEDDYNRNVDQWNRGTPRATRNAAIGLATALLLSLLGGVIGGWMASGEPMNFTHHLTRKPRYHNT